MSGNGILPDVLLTDILVADTFHDKCLLLPHGIPNILMT